VPDGAAATGGTPGWPVAGDDIDGDGVAAAGAEGAGAGSSWRRLIASPVRAAIAPMNTLITPRTR
jgi:hypothetical protein